MQLFLDPTSDRGMGDQLYDQLAEAISSGRLAAGVRLMPTRTAAAELGVSRSTVTSAYARLAAEGYIEGRRGGGSFVLDTLADDSAPESSSALRPNAVAAGIARYDGAAGVVRWDLTAGRVDHRLFPTVEWRRCLNRELTAAGAGIGRYGDPAGEPAVRRVFAHWVAQSRAVVANPEQVVITHGAAHAIDLVARTLLTPGDVAAVEEPGYPPVVALLRLLGARVVGVPVDRSGIVVDAIPDDARLVYVTPSHQYPLGAVMSRKRRLALLRWARRRRAAIVEDDYDTEFRYGARPLEPLQRLDDDGRVVYVGTFSKSLSPALRLGFAVLPTGIVPAVAAVRQAADFMPPLVTAATMCRFIEAGALDRHLRRARRAYSARQRILREALAHSADGVLTALPSEAGLHIAAMLRHPLPDDVLFQRAAERGLQISSLRQTYRFSEPVPGLAIGFGAIAGARDRVRRHRRGGHPHGDPTADRLPAGVTRDRAFEEGRLVDPGDRCTWTGRIGRSWTFPGAQHVPTLTGYAPASAARSRRARLDDEEFAMQPLTVDFIISLDGFGAAEGWPGWWGLESAEYLRWLDESPEKDDPILMGAKTYRLMSALVASGEPGTEELTAMPKIVFSSTLAEPLEWANSRLVRTDPVAAVRAMKAESDRPLRTLGSVSLCRSLLRAGLVDVYRVVIFPVITGATGADRIFDGYPDARLELTHSRTFEGGLQLLEYVPTVLDGPPGGGPEGVRP